MEQQDESTDDEVAADMVYVGEIQDVMFSTSEKDKSEALASYLDHQPQPLTTQFGERLSKRDTMEQQMQGRTTTTQLYPQIHKETNLEKSLAVAAAKTQARKGRQCLKCQ
eukprot:gene14926-6065_t